MRSYLLLCLLTLVMADRTLVYVEEFARHGARSPSTLFNFAKDPKDEFQAEMQLSAMGER